VRIDLHTHSTASDGTDSPAALVQVAHAAGLDVVAITDHDTTAGWEEAVAACPAGLTVVRGTEFSCKYVDASGRRINLHLLGYLFDPDHPSLRDARRELRASRRSRGRVIVDRMTAAGLPITWDEVSALAGGGAVGRPHIARALVAAGVVSSVDEAFAGPVSSRAPYYERKADLDVFETIRLLREAGGVTVFAHPIATRRGPVLPDDAIAELAAAGLAGLEVDHPDHDEHDRAHAAGLARDLDLLPTGSSDYHGTNKRTPIGACTTAPEVLEALLDRPTALAPIG
jgi:predicted metal-dependent phosphoesterase TrpH